MRKAIDHILCFSQPARPFRRVSWFRFLRSPPFFSFESSCLRVQPLPKFWCSLLLLASWWVPLSALADVTLQVTSSRPSIYLGESFNLTIEVNGADRGIEAPDLAGLPPSDVQFLGQNSNSRSSISIINGRMTREAFEGRVFAYQIKPSSQGVFKAGPVRVTAAGKVYTHAGVTVRVAGIEKQDSVIAAVTASSTSVLVEEPFTVTLSVAVAELPDPYADNNEPIHPNFLPQLSADFLEIRQNTPGLKGPDLNQLLNGLIDQSGRQPSFAINNYQSNDLFSQRPIRFRLNPKKSTLNSKTYREYTLSLDYTPTKEGEFTFGPLSFKGTVITDVSADRQAVTKEVYTIGPAVTVRVVPPPDEGRPECFTGSVGKGMKATAAFDATACKVGDPLTLTLELTGPISVSNLRTPILNLQPGLAKDFRIYDDNVAAETLPNGKRFKYRVRPTREGTLEFPPIKLAYYDTAARAYTTVTTVPVPIQARPTTQIATVADNGKANPAFLIDSRTRPLPAGITLAARGAHPDSLLPPERLVRLLLLAGPVLCLLAALVAPLAALVKALRTRRRRSGALHRSRRALRQADTPELAAHAVRAYLADRLDVAGNALTPTETALLLSQRNVPPETASACRDLLARLDEAMYRPDASAPLSEITRALQALLPRLDVALDQSDRSVRSAGSVLPLLFVLCSLSLPLHADDTSRAFLWEQANTQAASATKPEEYLKAAKTCNRLVADGVRNGPLFLNLGSTLVMAGDGANAIAAFARAERHLGATPETRQGIAASLALQSGRKHADLPWSRTAFFWHYAFPCPIRALTALGGWTLFWFGVLCRTLLKRRKGHALLRSLSETCMLTGGLIAVVFAASTFLTLANERHDEATWGSRVFISSTPSESEDAP